MPNPKCAEGPGCGDWTRPMKPNPDYKGKWTAPLIDNPEYKVGPHFYYCCFLCFVAARQALKSRSWPSKLRCCSVHAVDADLG